MPALICTLGYDPEDAALNRPVAVLGLPEYEALAALTAGGRVPLLAPLLAADAAPRRTFGHGELPTLRAELGTALAAIGAAQLPDSLITALTLQRLDSACWTALELGLNLYLVIERE